jgi:hypothetical protein
MKSYNTVKKVLILVFCIGMLNSCKKETTSKIENDNIEISKAKVSDLLTGGNSESVSKINKRTYRVFPNINLFPTGGPADRLASTKLNSLQSDNSAPCPQQPGYLHNMSLNSLSVGYDCNGDLEANFIVGIEYINGEPPGGVIITINGFQLTPQTLSYNIGDAQAYLVEHVPYMVIGDPCQANNANISVNAGSQVCGAGGIALGVNYNMPPIGGGQNGGSWQPSASYTTVIGQARLTVPIVICYTNPCFPGQPPFTNYTFRYKLQNTTTWTEVTVTYFQSQIGYTINNLPAGDYNLEGRDNAINPWVIGANGGVFTVL